LHGGKLGRGRRKGWDKKGRVDSPGGVLLGKEEDTRDVRALRDSLLEAPKEKEDTRPAKSQTHSIMGR